MRKLFRKFLPHHDTMKNRRWLKPFGGLLHHPNLWHLHRRSVAGGLAIGLFCGLIPGPLQMISAALLAILFRVNLPVAAVTTLYTNPLTIVPLYMLAYELGKWVSGAADGAEISPPSFSDLHWHNLMNELWDWLVTLGEPFLIGLPLLALSLAAIGYFAARLGWRLVVIWKWRARRRRRTRRGQ